MDEYLNNITRRSETPKITNSNIYDSNGGLKLKDNQIFSDDFLEKIKNYFFHGESGNIEIGGVTFSQKSERERKLLGSGIIISYEPEYNYIRISNSDYSGYPLNINFKTGEIYVMDARNPQSGSIKLFETLESLGLLKNDLPFIDREKIKKQKEENSFVDNFIKEHNRGDLPFSSNSILDLKKIKPVTQQEGIIINDPKEGEGLYTTGAGPCAIIIIKDSYNGKIGLAHVDGSIKSTSVISFLSYFNNPDISIISGEKSVVGNIILGLKTAGITNSVSFMNVDLNGDRIDSAGITIKDGKPTILYGHNSRIVFSDEQEASNRLIPFQTGEQPLKIKIN